MIELSIVIPAYNEESRITASLEKIVQWLSKKKLRLRDPCGG